MKSRTIYSIIIIVVVQLPHQQHIYSMIAKGSAYGEGNGIQQKYSVFARDLPAAASGTNYTIPDGIYIFFRFSLTFVLKLCTMFIVSFAENRRFFL